MLSASRWAQRFTIALAQPLLAFLLLSISLASDFALSGDRRWAVLASRESLSEAIDLASGYSNAKVFRSDNGWYAVVIGPYAARSMDALMQVYNGPSLPDDTYLARGKNFVEQEWPSATVETGPPNETETAPKESASSEPRGAEAGPAAGLGSNEMIWEVRSLDPHIVDVVLHAVNRHRAWPGGSQVYSLKDSDWHLYRLTCSPGEKICIGAGVRGDYSQSWGVAVDNSRGCTGCCYSCSGNRVSLTLDP